MGGQSGGPVGPDLAAGVELEVLREGEPLVGHVGGEAVMLVRRGDDVHATGASCTHYGGPLGEGLVVGDTVRCPWHHACFDLKTGEALGAPALSPIACWNVERAGGLVKVGSKREAEARARAGGGRGVAVVVVGAGAAGAAAVEALRAAGHEGPVTLVGDEGGGPVDRPNLSKDYLAGNAPEEWMHVRDAGFYAGLGVDFIAGDAVARLDLSGKHVELASGKRLGFGAVLLATGAEPVRLGLPGADAPHVMTLRTLADSRAIIARATGAKHAVVIGASFIGLEVAASLRTRGLEVTVVAPEAVPLARVLGDEVGRFVQGVHEGKGTRLRLGRKPVRIEARAVTLDDGAVVEADLVVMGVGVRPRVALAQAAGLRVDGGVVVDAELRTSAPGVWAAGDLASYPDPWSGERVRVEHWVHAERQGQAAARNLAAEARGEPGRAFRDVPFFWSAHHDVTFGYVGCAPTWARAELRGSLADRDAAVIYRDATGRPLAVATLGRDRVSLAVEAAMERGDLAGVEAALA